jgi:hypothetical protein
MISAGGTYWLEGIDIPIKGERIFNAEEFTNGDSERLNPFKYKPTDLEIQCSTANGRRSANWDLK